MIELSLKALAAYFKSQDFPCQILKATAKLPFDFIFVYFGDIEEKDKQPMQIRLVKQMMTEEVAEEGFKPDAKGYYQLQFTMTVDAKLKPEAYYETLRTVGVINRSLSMPGFEISEPDQAVYFRYAMMSAGEVDPYVLISVMGAVGMAWTSFAPTIASVAKGEKTFDDVFREMKEKAAEYRGLAEGNSEGDGEGKGGESVNG